MVGRCPLRKEGVLPSSMCHALLWKVLLAEATANQITSSSWAAPRSPGRGQQRPGRQRTRIRGAAGSPVVGGAKEESTQVYESNVASPSGRGYGHFCLICWHK